MLEQTRNNNAENFTLHDFVQVTGDTLLDRVTPFSDTLSDYTQKGLTLYAREVVSQPGPRVKIKDTLTGTVREMIMMGANDYLGFSSHPTIKQAVVNTVTELGVGMGGPPLLNGTSEVHRKLERALADLKGQEDALIFSSGFQANLGWTTALLRSGDTVIYDELNHASFFDGLLTARATRKVRAKSFRHNDLNELEQILIETAAKRQTNQLIYVAVEGLYSMDGDLAPLPQICDLCEKYKAILVVDDAHGTGVLGKNGGGASDHFGVSHRVDISMGTFSKTFGVTGGFLAGKKKVVDYLRFFSRSYVFSAHIPQSIAAGVLAGCEMIKAEPKLREQLHKNVDYMINGLYDMGVKVKTDSAIIPIHTPQPINLRNLNRALHEAGLFVNPIEYPAVSLDEQRIRLSLMATHTKADIDEALEIIRVCGKEHGLI